MYFDRFDICEAHWMFATLYHSGQGSRLYQKLCQLERMRFTPSPGLHGPEDLEENGREIYEALVANHS